MSMHPLPDSLSLFTESPDDELRYFFNLSRAMIKQSLIELSAAGGYTPQIARLRLLEEMLKEQLPAISNGSVGDGQ